MAGTLANLGKYMLDCPPEILEEIFSYLDVCSLYELAMACDYLEQFIEKPKFWKCIDVRNGNIPKKKSEYVTDKMNNFTTHFCIQGNAAGYGQIPTNFLKNMGSLSYLKVVALENMKFDGSKVCLKDFPVCLEELSVKNSFIQHPKFFFKHSDQRMRNLRVLIVDGCRWMNTTYFKWISKYVSMEIFSAVNCLNSDFYVAYIWDKDKCKRLKVIDFRFSLPAFGDDLVDVWSGSKPIHLVYFHNVAATVDDYGVNIMYCPRYYNQRVEDEISDESFEKYVDWVFGRDVTDQLPKSYLYKDPYAECTCDYKNKDKPTSSCTTQTTVVCPEYNFTSFMHKDAASMNWDSVSCSEKESEYMCSDEEIEFDETEGKLERLAIRKISLRGFKKVTNKSLEYLKDIELDVLDVTGTTVTEEGVNNYLALHPNCRVVHPLYCVCKPMNPF